jgi:hypothetical protein
LPVNAAFPDTRDHLTLGLKCGTYKKAEDEDSYGYFFQFGGLKRFSGHEA